MVDPIGITNYPLDVLHFSKRTGRHLFKNVKSCHRGLTDIEVSQGNHRVCSKSAKDSKYLQIGESPLIVYHFRYRTIGQMAKKLINGGKSYLAREAQGKNNGHLGGHWTDGYAQLEKDFIPNLRDMWTNYHAKSAVQDDRIKSLMGLNQFPTNTLRGLLRAIALEGADVSLFLPRGNSGDRLILEGLYQILAEVGIRITHQIKPNDCPPPFNGQSPRVLLVAGGGSWCEHFNWTARRTSELAPLYDKTVVFPSTFDMNVPLIREIVTNLPDTTYLFCRDYKSFVFLRDRQRTYLEHDSAFSFDYTSRSWLCTVDEPLPLWTGPILGNLYTRVLFALRSDKDSKSWRRFLPDGAENLDISDTTKNDYNLFLSCIESADCVVTDRAHVMIGAAMLGKIVFAVDNGYYKVRSMYDYSLHSCRNVRFLETLEGSFEEI